MKKCIIQTRIVKEDGSMTPVVKLEPLLHKVLYDIPVIRNARKIMSDNPEIQMLCIVLGQRYYTILIIEEDKPEFENYAFQLDPTAASAVAEEASD